MVMHNFFFYFAYLIKIKEKTQPKNYFIFKNPQSEFYYRGKFCVTAMLFPGSNNAILLKREYYQEYSCEFDLRYYPFDTQMCEMIFQIQGKTDQYVKLVRDSIGKTRKIAQKL